LRRATPRFREANKEADLRAAFAAADASLGSLVEYRAVGGKANFLATFGDKPLTADYIVRGVRQRRSRHRHPGGAHRLDLAHR
jgi:hypothetical protein